MAGHSTGYQGERCGSHARAVRQPRPVPEGLLGPPCYLSQMATETHTHTHTHAHTTTNNNNNSNNISNNNNNNNNTNNTQR